MKGLPSESALSELLPILPPLRNIPNSGFSSEKSTIRAVIGRLRRVWSLVCVSLVDAGGDCWRWRYPAVDWNLPDARSGVDGVCDRSSGAAAGQVVLSARRTRCAHAAPALPPHPCQACHPGPRSLQVDPFLSTACRAKYEAIRRTVLSDSVRRAERSRARARPTGVMPRREGGAAART